MRVHADAAVAEVTGGASGGRTAVLAVVGRLGWGVADQAVSSLSNFALSLYVARAFGVVAFGAFSLAFVTYTVVLNASRGVATDPLLVRHSGSVRRAWRSAASASSATALLIGTVAGVLCALGGLAAGQPVGPVFLALGVGLPGIALQDSWRFAFFAGARPQSALINDVVWTTLLVAALAALYVSGRGDVVLCMLAFGVTATFSALFGTLQAGVLPRPARVPAWLHSHRDLSTRYVVENVSSSGATQLRSFALGAVAGLAAVGEVRSAELLMGPFLVVLMGVSQVAVPEVARILKRAPRRVMRFCLVLGAAQGFAALVWGLGLLLILPLGIGQFLLKDIWPATYHLLIPVDLVVVEACFSTAASAGLRALGVAWRSVRAQLSASGLYLAGGIGGAAFAGAAGTCWGIAGANVIGVAVWWVHLRRALEDRTTDDGRIN